MVADAEINADLFEALTEVLGYQPMVAEPVVILTWYLHSLSGGYGLSEHQSLTESQFDRVEIPESAAALINHCLSIEGAPIDVDSLRDRLYEVFVELSNDSNARKTLNKNSPLSETGLLTAAQIFWNLEATRSRKKLPLRSGAISTKPDKWEPADIKVPDANLDFASMLWTARVNQKATSSTTGQAYKSSGQSFRKQGARLAVLAAKLLLDGSPQPIPAIDGASLGITEDRKPKALIIWAANSSRASIAVATAVTKPDPINESVVPLPAQRSRAQVLGGFAEVGAGYQRRSFDEEIESLWAEAGDRRIWLRGSPGHGKSYTARRVMQDALSKESEDRESLVVWVESADAQAVTHALSAAVDRMPQLGISLDSEVASRVERQARNLLELLLTSRWRWLLVFDNANADELISRKLIPAGMNPNGRILITTRSPAHRIDSHGHVIEADLFTPDEAEKFIGTRLPHTLSIDRKELATVVGRFPLALSIAAATIEAKAMGIGDWINEFVASTQMDTAANARDKGGYQHSIGDTWRIALEKASAGFAEGVVERAALVAALQDPDGHPTWLWERKAVIGWVTGESKPTANSGIPGEVQALIEYGIVEFRGNQWKYGRVAIHQLAARAIQEHADPARLTELAAILASEWLVQITNSDSPAQPHNIKKNLGPLDSLRGLPIPTQNTITALLNYPSARDDLTLSWARKQLELLSPFLTERCVIGRAHFASEFFEIGTMEEQLEQLDEAHESFTRAKTTYQEIIENGAIGDELCAGYLLQLGLLEEKLGNSDQAHEHFVQATQLYEVVSGTSTDVVDLRGSLVNLVRLYEKLGDNERKVSLLDHISSMSLEELSAPLPAPNSADPWKSMHFGKDLATLGRRDEALEYLNRSAREFDDIGLSSGSITPSREIARLYIEAKSWEEAERVMKGVTRDGSGNPDDLLLLASIQQRRECPADVQSTLDQIAEQFPKLESRRQGTVDVEALKLQADIESVVVPQLASMVEGILMGLANAAKRWRRWDDLDELVAALLGFAQDNPKEDLEAQELWIAILYFERGDVAFMNEDYDAALEHYKNADSIFQVLYERDSDDGETSAKYAATRLYLALVQERLGEYENAINCANTAISLLRLPSADPRAEAIISMGLNVLGSANQKLGLQAEAIDAHVRLVAINRALAEEAPDDESRLTELADAHTNLGRAYSLNEQWDEAVGAFTQSIDILQDLTKKKINDLGLLGNLLWATTNLGEALKQLDQIDQAIVALQALVVRMEAIVEQDPSNHKVQEYLAMALGYLGGCHMKLNDWDDATANLSRAYNIMQLPAELNPRENREFFLSILRELEVTLRELGREVEAQEAFAKAEDFAARHPDREDIGDTQE